MHARAGAGDFLNVLDALCRFEDRMDEERLLQPVLRFELRQQLVEIMDIPCPFDLGQHDHIELVADLGDEFGDVVEHPGAVQRVDAGPEARCAEIMGPADLDDTLACRFLGIGRNRIFQIAEQHVDLRNDLADPCTELLVVPREEMDHAFERHRQLAVGGRGADSEGLVEV